MAKKSNTKNKKNKKVNNNKRIIETSSNTEVSKVIKCIAIILKLMKF